jgi:biopolymer transport protein ExbD
LNRGILIGRSVWLIRGHYTSAVGINVGGVNRGRRSRGTAALSEINVTPFVDVALVLLIIFMITAHVMEYGIEIDVPKTKTVATSTKDLPVIQVSKSGETYLGKDPVNINLIAQEVRSKYPGQTSVYVRADAQTPFDPIANVLSVLGDAKLAPVIVTQPDDRVGKRR